MPAFTTPGPIAATVEVAGAQVRVGASDRTDTVVLVEPVNKASRSDVKVAENTKVDFSGGQLTVKTTVEGNKNGSVAITIDLPAGSSLAASVAHSSVLADGPLGECELHMASGRVHERGSVRNSVPPQDDPGMSENKVTVHARMLVLGVGRGEQDGKRHGGARRHVGDGHEQNGHQADSIPLQAGSGGSGHSGPLSGAPAGKPEIARRSRSAATVGESQCSLIQPLWLSSKRTP